MRQLLAEKAKFEKWLTDLDAKRASTPAHVFDRVHTDYTGRLQGVLDRLKSHSAAMQDHATQLSKKLEQLGETEQGLADTLAESELRAQVGELAEGEWEKISKKLERDIGKIKQDQELIAADLEDLRALLSETSERPSAASSPVASAVQAPADAPAARTSKADPAESAGANVDELAFLKSVIGTAPAASGSRSPKPAADEKPAAQKAPVEAAPVAAKPAAEKLIESPAPSPVLKPKGGDEPLAMHVTGANPIVLRTSGVMEQPKTLKCGECGSMNYASEWYCERCGAELTSV